MRYLLIGIALQVLCIACAEGQNLQVCKRAPLPAARVIVGELETFDCDPPGKASGWDTVVPVDGTVACETPRLDAAGSVLQYVLCGLTTSNTCPATFDGSPNAVVLRTPQSCDQHSTPGFHQQCKNASWPAKESVVVGATQDPKCGHANAGETNSWVLRDISESLVEEPVLACTTASGDPIGHHLSWYEVIVRRFNSSFCDGYASISELRALNAVVFFRVNSPPKGITLCNGTPLSDPKNAPAGVSGPMAQNLKRLPLYDPLCGGARGDGPNGFKVVGALDK
jgi:hypothetical protein